VKALSDGVYAIVLTLLVLELKVPEIAAEISGREFWVAMVPLIPKFLSYLITFMIAGLSWIVHTRLFRHITGYDRRLLWRNLLSLFFVTLLPFTASLLGEHPLMPMTTVLYALNMVFTSLFQARLWKHAVRSNYVGDEVTPVLARYIHSRIMVIPVAFGVAAVLASLGFRYGMVAGYIVPLALIFVHKRFSKLATTDNEDEPSL